MTNNNDNTGNTILNGTNFSNDDLTFKPPEVNPKGGKHINIVNTESKRTLFVSTPLMLTWGVNENDFDGNGRYTYDMSLQFPKEEYDTPAQQEFLKNMQGLETHIRELAKKNSKEWLNKPKLTDEVLDVLLTPMLRYPKDKETGEFDYTRPPCLRLKLHQWDGAFKCEVYNVNKEPLFTPNMETPLGTPKELIPKGAMVSCIIQAGGIWFANGKMSVTWKLFQAVVKPRATLSGTCHINLSTDDMDTLDKQTTNDESTTLTVDSDEESESEEVVPSFNTEVTTEVADELQHVEETTPRKKKVVRRKKKVMTTST
jgi:hypothetical protein